MVLTAYWHIEVVRGCDASVLVPFVATAERPERATIFDEIRRDDRCDDHDVCAGGTDKGTEPAHILTYSLASCATVFTAVAVTAARPKHDPRNYPGIPRYRRPAGYSYAQYMVPYSYIP